MEISWKFPDHLFDFSLSLGNFFGVFGEVLVRFLEGVGGENSRS